MKLRKRFIGELPVRKMGWGEDQGRWGKPSDRSAGLGPVKERRKEKFEKGISDCSTVPETLDQTDKESSNNEPK